MREAGCGRAVELVRRIEIVAGHPVGPGHVAHGSEGAKWHRVTAGVAHANLQHVLRVEPITPIRLRRHAENAAQQVEVVDVGGAQIRLQCAEHIGHVDAQHLYLGAVDVEIELRRRGLEQREHLGEAGRLRGAAHHGVDGTLKRLRAGARAVLHHHAEAP